MQKHRVFWASAFATLLILWPLSAQATTVNVNCNGSNNGSNNEQTNTIGSALKMLNPEGPNTVNVSGSCKENVLIQGFGRLTLTANPGASITDASGGASTVVDIEDSTNVTLQGFTINGGDIGVFCGDLSVCRFKSNTIQNTTASVNGDGIGVVISRSRAIFDGDVVQNNAARGLNIVGASSARGVNIQVRNNGEQGIFVAGGSAFFGGPATIENNALSGVVVYSHSTFTLSAGTISANKAHGVRVTNSSEADINSFAGPTTITGNSLNGVRIEDVSFATFTTGAAPISVTGNASGDVQCAQIPFAARGSTTDIGGGSTNCIEPN